MRVQGVAAGILVGAVCVAAGCARTREAVKCVAGVSTRALERARASALVRTFALDYRTCQARVLQTLEHIGAYVYAKDEAKRLVAAYATDSNNTPVGFYFKEITPGVTQLDVVSESTSVRESYAKRVFTSLERNNETIAAP